MERSLRLTRDSTLAQRSSVVGHGGIFATSVRRSRYKCIASQFRGARLSEIASRGPRRFGGIVRMIQEVHIVMMPVEHSHQPLDGRNSLGRSFYMVTAALINITRPCTRTAHAATDAGIQPVDDMMIP